MPFVRSESVKEKPVGTELSLYVGEHRSIHVLNPTARFIWESLRDPLTFDELLFVMGEAFTIDAATLQLDLRETLDRFVALGVLHSMPDVDAHAEA